MTSEPCVLPHPSVQYLLTQSVLRGSCQKVCSGLGPACILCVCPDVSVCVCRTQQRPEVLDPAALTSQVVVLCCVVLGTQPGSSA